MSDPLETKVTATVLGGAIVSPTIIAQANVSASAGDGITVNVPVTGGIEVLVGGVPAIEVAAETSDGVTVNATAEGGVGVAVGIGGTSSDLVLQTNGVTNGSQSLLNLAAGSGITLTDNGSGTVTITATGGGGGGITELTGDGTAGPGSGSQVFTLATVNSNVGTFGSATKAVVFTTNGKGLTTAASEVTITPAIGSITGLGTGVATALGNAVNASGGVLTVGGGGYEAPLTFSTGLTRTVNTVTVNTSQNIATLSNLTNNGLVTTSGGVGTLSVTVPGTGVLTALGVNVGSAGAFVTFGGALGTPSSGVGTNLTALTAANITASTTVGRNLLNLTNPSAITFIRINADNSVDALNAANFRTAIGAGTGGGDVVGPASATDGAFALFDSTTGKLIKNSSAPGTGVMTALAINVGNAGAFVTFNGAAGTPSSLVGTNISGTAASLTAGHATALTTGRTISISGDITYTSPSFDGSGNVTAAGTLATVNISPATYGSATKSAVIVVNGKGLVTASSEVTIAPTIASVTGLGTGVATALATNVGTASSFVVNGGVLGTPSSGNASNLTNIPASGISGVIPIANLATGTPTGAKFVRDDGTLAIPAGAGGDVVGPGASTVSFFPQWNNTSGTLLKAGVAGSTGGNASADNGKVALFGSGGVFSITDGLGVAYSGGGSLSAGYNVNSVIYGNGGNTYTMYSPAKVLANRVLWWPDASGSPAMSTTAGGSFLSGLVITSNATDATNDLNISGGIASDDSGEYMLCLNSDYVKQQDAAWAVGTNAGGMWQTANLSGTISTTSTTAIVGTSTTFLTDFVVGDVIATAGGRIRRITVVTDDTHMTAESAMATETGVTYKKGGKAPNTSYYIYLMWRSDTQVVDVLFTTRNPSQTVTLPTAYDEKRLIGMFHNDATPAINGITMARTDEFRARDNIAQSTTVATNTDTGLQWYAGANEVWQFDCLLKFTVPAGGMKIQLTAPTGGTLESYEISIPSTTLASINLTAINTLSGNIGTTGTYTIRFSGVLVNGSSAGTVALGIASVTGTQTTTLSANYWLHAKRSP